MNCCHENNDNNNGNEKGKHKGHLSHMLMMALCCGAPILILLIVPFWPKTGVRGWQKLYPLSLRSSVL